MLWYFSSYFHGEGMCFGHLLKLLRPGSYGTRAWSVVSLCGKVRYFMRKKLNILLTENCLMYFPALCPYPIEMLLVHCIIDQTFSSFKADVECFCNSLFRAILNPIHSTQGFIHNNNLFWWCFQVPNWYKILWVNSNTNMFTYWYNTVLEWNTTCIL